MNDESTGMLVPREVAPGVLQFLESGKSLIATYAFECDVVDGTPQGSRYWLTGIEEAKA